MRSIRILCGLLGALAACGDNVDVTPDAAPPEPDASTLPTGCDHAELRDSSNDGYAQNPGREATNLTFASSLTLCGNVDTTHYANTKVDADSYTITLAAPATVLVTYVGAGLETVGLAEVDVFGGDGLVEYVGTATFRGAYGIRAFDLDAGVYEISSYVAGDAAIATAIPYQIRITLDTPAMRCSTPASTDFTEMRETATTSGDNDMVTISLNVQLPPPMRQVLTPAADQAEATGFTIGTTDVKRASGTFASVPVNASYREHDTYLITTGPMTNKLELRARWTATDTDVDLFLFAADTVPALGRSVETDDATEAQVFAVLPNTMYWVWAGVHASSAGTTPVPYSVTFCGSMFPLVPPGL